MLKSRLLDTPDRVGLLASRLGQCPEVNKLDKHGEDPEAANLAYTLAELEESFCRFIDEHLTRLTDERTPSADLYEILHEIGEELRHILYHIGDSEFYRYLPPWGGGERDDN